MTLSTGLGAGFVLDRKIYRGAHGLATEIWAFDQGLFPVADREVIINDMGSGSGMIKEALRYIQAGEETEIPPTVADSRIILEASERGNRIAELKTTPIVRAQLSEDVVLYGAVGLVIECLKTS